MRARTPALHAAILLLLVTSAASAAPCRVASLGAEVTNISDAMRRARNIPSYIAGAMVRFVWAGSPAGRAGVGVSDVIQGVGDQLVQNACDFRAAFEKQGCGDTRLHIRRGIDTIAIDVHVPVNVRFPRKTLDDAAACRRGDGGACAAMAKAHRNNIVLLRQACDLGDSEGCFLLGLELKNKGSGDKEALAAYEQACDAGNALACTNLGWMMQNGRGARADLQAALRLYKHGCDGSSCAVPNNLGCLNLGRMIRDGIGVSADHPRALRIFRDVCGRTPLSGDDEDAGNIVRACSLAGTESIFGKGLIHDVPDGLALLEKGCAGGDAFGCFNLGVVYELGNEVNRDNARAAKYYRKACDRSDAEACQRLGALLK